MHRPVTLLLRPRRVVPPAGPHSGLDGHHRHEGHHGHRGHRAVLALEATVAVVALAALTSCSTQSEAQTQVPYIPADGVPASIGTVVARDLLLVAPSVGATGVLSGSVLNTGSSPVEVTFLTVADAQSSQSSTGSQSSSAPGTTMRLAANQQEQITGVQFPNVQAPPGAMTGIVLKTSAGQQNVQVPVLLPEGPYASITATPTTPSTSTTGGSTASTSATSGSSPTSAGATASATGTAATGTPTTASPTSSTG